jgi:protein-L-isoaspartate(D-aspartate) O-methyltransferase
MDIDMNHRGPKGFRVIALAAMLAAGEACGATDAEYAALRSEMVAEINATRPGGAIGPLDARVMDAIGRVSRHRFVPDTLRLHAYENRPLPIGHGQTISQPYVVAVMTDLLALRPEDRVLEIGTGSGYQAAILAELVRSVCTIEIIEPLALEARERLEKLGYRNVEVKVGDGYDGWEARAPFDAIMVTAAASHVPPPLVRQLKPGGRMVIPVGASFMVQHLMLVEKRADGSITSRQILPVRFVPLTGGR